MRGFLRDFAEDALEALSRPAADWREEDVAALCDLHREIADANEKDAGGATVEMPRGMAEAFRRLDRLVAGFGGAAEVDDLVPLDGEMERLVRDALEACDGLLANGSCPEDARRALRQLGRLLRAALERGKLRMRQLSDRSELARRRSEGAFRQGARSILAAIGRRLDLAPAGTVFLDSTASFAPEMVVISSGRFWMGSPEKEEDRLSSEGPRHEVQIGARFALARYALTFEEYGAFCAATERAVPKDEGWGKDCHPVINVSWKDAVDYCAWLSETTGAQYRLPSEAEWEYACRAGTETAFSFGDRISTVLANYNGEYTWGGSPRGTYRGRTVAVDHGEFGPNPFGLWQMHGNVFEWCADDWTEDYTEPRSQAPFVADPRAARRVVRGGSWYSEPWFLRSADRRGFGPGSRDVNLGFRPARTLLTS